MPCPPSSLIRCSRGPIPNDDIPLIAGTAHIERGVVAVEPEQLVLGAVLHHDLIAISAELDNRVPRRVLDYNRALSAVELDPLLRGPIPNDDIPLVAGTAHIERGVVAGEGEKWMSGAVFHCDFALPSVKQDRWASASVLEKMRPSLRRT